MSMTPEDRRVAVIIDDDPDIRELIELVLSQSGFDTYTAANGRDGVDAVREHRPMVTTLDVSMPGMDGIATARIIREHSDTYILMLTALGEEIDVVEGLGAGADDYLTKPFRARELRARVEAGLRRPRVAQANGTRQEPAQAAAAEPVEPVLPPAPTSAPATPVMPLQAMPPMPAFSTEVNAIANPPAAEQPAMAQPAMAAVAPESATTGVVNMEVLPDGQGELVHNGVSVNRATRVVVLDGRTVALTRSEFDLLATVLESGRRVRSKADLVLELRGESYVTDYYVTDADKRTVEVHMANLRRKLGDNSNTPRFIETVRGVGYRLAETD